ncbi:hypothetical protein [Thalassolituus oleivorans]|uniref:hypothetical protein n=1 Tax=Thalassolituus oleivorans TaxID=187493 RepID=UPI0023F2E810|nr:hypothetical protein [Thalassolituus oleivorans]
MTKFSSLRRILKIVVFVLIVSAIPALLLYFFYGLEKAVPAGGFLATSLTAYIVSVFHGKKLTGSIHIFSFIISLITTSSAIGLYSLYETINIIDLTFYFFGTIYGYNILSLNIISLRENTHREHYDRINLGNPASKKENTIIKKPSFISSKKYNFLRIVKKIEDSYLLLPLSSESVDTVMILPYQGSSLSEEVTRDYFDIARKTYPKSNAIALLLIDTDTQISDCKSNITKNINQLMTEIIASGESIRWLIVGETQEIFNEALATIENNDESNQIYSLYNPTSPIDKTLNMANKKGYLLENFGLQLDKDIKKYQKSLLIQSSSMAKIYKEIQLTRTTDTLFHTIRSIESYRIKLTTSVLSIIAMLALGIISPEEFIILGDNYAISIILLSIPVLYLSSPTLSHIYRIFSDNLPLNNKSKKQKPSNPSQIIHLTINENRYIKFNTISGYKATESFIQHQKNITIQSMGASEDDEAKLSSHVCYDTSWIKDDKTNSAASYRLISSFISYSSGSIDIQSQISEQNLLRIREKLLPEGLEIIKETFSKIEINGIMWAKYQFLLANNEQLIFYITLMYSRTFFTTTIQQSSGRSLKDDSQSLEAIAQEFLAEVELSDKAWPAETK